MRIIDRVDEYIKHKRLKSSQFEAVAGLGNSILDKARKSKKGNLSADTLDKILKVYTDLNELWLKCEIGDMIKEEDTKPANTAAEPAADYNNSLLQTINSQQRTINSQQRTIEKLTDIIASLTNEKSKTIN